MKFTDLLRAGTLLSAASATVLAAGSMLYGVIDGTQSVVLLCTIWWLITGVGALIASQARGGKVSRSVGKLLADARPQRMQHEPRMGRTVANRLWPLGLLTLLALIGTTALGAQIAGLGAGFPIVWALLWRGQESAVKAVEERDGVAFHVEPTGPLQPMKLTRGPGLRRDLPSTSKVESKRTAST